MSIYRMVLVSLAFTGAATSLSPTGAWAQATDLVCTGCVETSDIKGGAVTSGKIANGEVKTPDLAADAVTSPRIKDGQVKTPDLANEAVTTGKLAVGAVRGGRIANGAVTTNKIGPGAVTFDRLAPDVAAAIGGGIPPGPVEVDVDCAAGDTVQDAVDAAISGQGTTIMIAGVCNENVLILKDRIALQGANPANDQIVGVPETDPFVESPIALIGAQLVVIDNLTVSDGQSSGITATSSFFTVSNSVIENNGNNGIAASAGSTARIDNNLIRGNTWHGINVGAGFAQITNNTIQSNDLNGIQLFTGGNALIGETLGGTVEPNTISSNDSGVVALGGGTTNIRNNTIENNTRDGVRSVRGGSVALTNNTVRLNGRYGVYINEGSNGRIEAGNTIESDASDYNVGAVVAVYRSSSLRVRGDNVLRNNADTFITEDSGNAGAFALDVEMVSSFRQDGGHTTFVGNIESFNQTTVDLRNADITGSLYADGLDGNIRIRDQSQPSANVTLTGGNLYTFGDPVSIKGPGDPQQPIFDGDIVCGGNFVGINSPNFINGHGFVNCPAIP